MVKISDIETRLLGHQWKDGILDIYPQLDLKIRATSNGADICHISYKYNDGVSIITDSLDISLLEAIAKNMKNSDSSLLRSLNDVDFADKEDICRSHSHIFGLSALNVLSIDQIFINIFLIQIAIYLIICKLLYDNVLWRSLPLYFELPFDIMDSRMLTSQAMSYMKYPISASRVLGSPFVQEISCLLIGLINIWAMSYEDGEILEINDKMQSLILNTAESVLSNIDSKMITGMTLLETANYQILNNSVCNLSNSIDKIAKRLEIIDEKFSAFDERLSIIDKKLEKVDQHFSTVDQRLKNINEKFNQRPGTTNQQLRIDDQKLLILDKRLKALETIVITQTIQSRSL